MSIIINRCYDFTLLLWFAKLQAAYTAELERRQDAGEDRAIKLYLAVELSKNK